MSDETLSDPVLGTLRRLNSTEWLGHVWFTPKHEIEVVFDQWMADADDVPEQLERASAAYAALRPREWEYRMKTAEQVDDHLDGDWEGNDGPEAGLDVLARQLLLVRSKLFGDHSASFVYHLPAPLDDREICTGINPDGSFDDVDVFSR